MAVYFVRCQDFVKVGYSSTPMKRIANLQIGNPFTLEVLIIIPGSVTTETELHNVFSDLHYANEWYRYEGLLKQYVENNKDIFANYTMKHQSDVEYEDERDWEHWKTGAINAEKKIQTYHSINTGQGLTTEAMQELFQMPEEESDSLREKLNQIRIIQEVTTRMNPLAHDVLMMIGNPDILGKQVAEKHGVSEATVSRLKSQLNGKAG